MGAQSDAAGGPGKRLIADPQLRAELELCDRWGLPHSTFIGAGNGRWTAADRAKALAFVAYRSDVCDGCGTRAEEWDDESGGDRFAYVAHTWRCLGCEVIAQEQEQVPDDIAQGMKVGLIPRQPTT